jgi:hypothetical protein
VFKKDNNNVIVFRAQGEHVMEVREKPVPSIKMIPKWWKELSPYTEGSKKFKMTRTGPNTTVKKCAPCLDSLGAGYIVTLWSDLMIEQIEGKPLISWNTYVPVVAQWSEDQVTNFEIPEGYSKSVFKYSHGWTIKTPKGWSALIIHPIGYPNLPIKSISGLVDTDKLETDINVPFVIKDGFEGIIPKGTPMFQVIPIKRSKWKSSFELEDDRQLYINQEKLRSQMESPYARTQKEKKEYE